MSDHRAHQSNVHEQMMAAALAEAARGRGRTRPNPMVGCVIVRNGEVLARGHHARAGGDHAEVAALKALKAAGHDARGCDAYVNLEPCCHRGRTGPCSVALINAGIRRVFIGTLDPYPAVSGGGVQALRAAGVEVICGVLEEACRALNRPYFKRIACKMPWVVVKYAMTLDGKIATATGDSAWISSEASRRIVHQLRDTHDAIMVGTGTLLSDNPRLTSRIEGGRNPMRVVLDRRLRAPLDASVFQPPATNETDEPDKPDKPGAQDGAQTLVFIGENAAREDAISQKRSTLQARGILTHTVEEDAQGRLDLKVILEELSRREVMSVLVEGGAKLLGSLFDQQLVDEVHVFVAPRIIGGAAAPGPIAGQGHARMVDALNLEELAIDIVDPHDVWIRGVLPAATKNLAAARR